MRKELAKTYKGRDDNMSCNCNKQPIKLNCIFEGDSLPKYAKEGEVIQTMLIASLISSTTPLHIAYAAVNNQ